jgi:hypothetical protein
VTKNILISGILGGAAMFVVILAGRILLPGLGHVRFQTMPDQVKIHAALKERITKPGTYVCPYLPSSESAPAFPDYLNEPIFAVTYKGYTHATVPGFASVGILSFLLAPMAAAWLLAQASEWVLATFLRRVVYVAALGLFVALAADLLRTLTEEEAFTTVAGMAVVRVIAWAAAGLILAWRIKPKLELGIRDDGSLSKI